MLDIIGKYSLDDLVKGKNDAETAIALMNWLCGRYKHGNPPGGLSGAGVYTPQGLMNHADKNEGRTNCRGLSMILANLIRAYDIKAYYINCLPYEEPFDDCHVVVCVYCESIGKYIMLDPSYNLYLKNMNGEIIGVEELRDILIAGGKLFPNENNTDFSEYREYMAKNLVRITRYLMSDYDNTEQGGSITLVPEKYMQNEALSFSDTERGQFITSKEDFWKI